MARWLDGDATLTPPVAAPRRQSAAPFQFAGGTYSDVKSLAAAMVANWEAAKRTVARADGLLAWLKDEAKEYEAWQWLSEIAEEKAQLDPGMKVTLLLPMLNPDLPVMFEGQELTQKRLLKLVREAAEGKVQAGLPALWEHMAVLEALATKATWLKEAKTFVDEAKRETDKLICDLRSMSVFHPPPKALIEMASKTQIGLAPPLPPERPNGRRQPKLNYPKFILEATILSAIGAIIPGFVVGFIIGATYYTGYNADVMEAFEIGYFSCAALIFLAISIWAMSSEDPKYRESRLKNNDAVKKASKEFRRKRSAYRKLMVGWTEELKKRKKFNEDIRDAKAEVARFSRIEVELKQDKVCLSEAQETLNGWAFIAHILSHSWGISGFNVSSGRLDDLLAKVPENSIGWVKLLKELPRHSASRSWVLLRMETRLTKRAQGS